MDPSGSYQGFRSHHQFPLTSRRQSPSVALSDKANGSGATAGPSGDEDTATATVAAADKKTIYQHPLFPLLLMLFEKCELATQTTECPSARSIDSDIRLFVAQMQSAGKSLLADSHDVDSLMVHSIEVLRMNLLELEKVGDLCKDFCQRYIACLKSKMQSDNLLKPLGEHGLGQPSPVVDTAALSRVVSGSGLHSLSPSRDISRSPGSSLTEESGKGGPTSGSLPTTPPPPLGRKRKKSRRSVLPKAATNTMKAWLFQHLAHPYPTEDEKRRLAIATNLTLLQVNNWFINARRRILQPMLDAASGAEPPKAKKPRTGHALKRLQERHWLTMAKGFSEEGSDNDIGPAGDSLMLESSCYDCDEESPRIQHSKFAFMRNGPHDDEGARDEEYESAYSVHAISNESRRQKFS